MYMLCYLILQSDVDPLPHQNKPRTNNFLRAMAWLLPCFGGKKGGSAQERSSAPQAPTLRQQSSYIVTLALSYFLCVSISIPYVKCILCHAKRFCTKEIKHLHLLCTYMLEQSMNHISLENRPRCYAKLSTEQDGNILWQVGTLPDHTPV